MQRLITNYKQIEHQCNQPQNMLRIGRMVKTIMSWSGGRLAYMCECESDCVKSNLHAWVKGAHDETGV